jgi:hypothetical protein
MQALNILPPGPMADKAPMPTDNDTSAQTGGSPSDVDINVVLARLGEVPEAVALEIYSQLSPRLQWLARQMMTGPRRKVLIEHHLRTNGRFR